ncbi:MAG TPA: hypothetical protein VEB21_16815 [Terriglobales bacterium]|nr:hypothetical protein [Terriglobales bacterium]
MKRTAIALLVALQLSVATAASAAIDEYDDDQSHPLRMVAYVLHPVGYLAEWLFFRPFHYVVAAAGPVFGHTQHGRKNVER